MKTVVVTKNGVRHDCTTEVQLKRFLDAGYKKTKPRKSEDESDAKTEE